MFFKKEDKDKGNDFVKVAALLIHAAKIDENFTKKEEELISQTLLKLGVDKENLENIISKGKIMEEHSNQILDFTREIKNMEKEKKIEIIESLWRIIFSNKEVDIY